ncbi:MAG: TIGR03943 family protein [Synechococcaceae cyanobacterium SM2_3_60]|nr:TIGR03943 family protein [Synechococcaceae cyanobacterium SM2_3_60]
MIDALALGLIGVLLLKYWQQGKLALLIHPMYVPLVVVCGVVLIAFASVRLLKHRHFRPGEHTGLLFPPALAWGLLAVLLLLGTLLPPRPLSSAMALQRGASELLPRQPQQQFRLTFNPADRSLADWVRTLSVYPDPDRYVGQPADISGFVIKPDWDTGDPALDTELFLLGQFVISCCAADAYPITLPIQWPTATEILPDSWQAITGTMAIRTIQGLEQLVLIAETVTEIPVPKSPYVFGG